MREHGGTLELQSGVKESGVAGAGEVREYSYKVVMKESLLEVALSQYSGDSDLSLSLLPGCQSPTVLSTRQGNDIISLSHTERQSWFNQTRGWLYICVLSVAESAFSISAREDTSRSKWLMFNTQERGEVRLNHWEYYQIPVGKGESMNVTVEVSVITGNPDLYVTLCRLSQCLFKEESVHHPEECTL